MKPCDAGSPDCFASWNLSVIVPVLIYFYQWFSDAAVCQNYLRTLKKKKSCSPGRTPHWINENLLSENQVSVVWKTSLRWGECVIKIVNHLIREWFLGPFSEVMWVGLKCNQRICMHGSSQASEGAWALLGVLDGRIWPMTVFLLTSCHNPYLEKSGALCLTL